MDSKSCFQTWVKPAFTPAIAVALTSLFFLPGFTSVYNLPKQSITGFFLIVLAFQVFKVYQKNADFLLTTDSLIFRSAVLFFLISIMLPLFTTPFFLSHSSGVLHLLLNFSFAVFTAIILKQTDLLTRQSVLFIIVKSGMIISLIIILQVLQILPQPELSREYLAHGTMSNPNWAAFYLTPLVPLTVALLSKTSNNHHRFYIYLILFFISSAVLLTHSKTGILTLLIVYFILIFIHVSKKNKKRYVISFLLILITLTILILSKTESFAVLHSWIRGRFFLWKAALFIAKDYPFTGIGFGGFLPAFTQYAAEIINGNPDVYLPLATVEFVHNEYLQILAENGCLALFTFIIFLFVTIKAALFHKNSLYKYVAISLIAIMISSVFDSPLQVSASGLLYWFLCGFVMAGEAKVLKPFKNTKRFIFLKRIPLLLIFIVLILTIGQTCRMVIGNWTWTKGMESRKAGKLKETAQYLNTAVRFLPDYGPLRSAKARTLFALGQTNKALGEVNISQTLYSNFDDIFFRTRIIKKKYGREAEFSEWKQMKNKFPMLVTPRYHLAEYYLETGQKDKAKAELLYIVQKVNTTLAVSSYQIRALEMLQTIANNKND